VAIGTVAHARRGCVGCGHCAFEFWGIGVGCDANFGFEYGYIARTRPFYIWLAEGDADELCLWGVEMLPYVGVHLTLERAGA